MASITTTRNGSDHAATVPNNASAFDLESRATGDDHQALRLWLRMLSCTVRIQNHIRAGLRREFSTTLPRFDLMAQLERHPNGLRMNELSQRLMVSGGNITGITDQLEREHLVTRTLDPGDRRAMTVKLTPTGLKRFREMAARNEQWTIELMQGLSREEKRTILEILSKLKLHLGNHRFDKFEVSSSQGKR
jgi:DNA-binding MarR family transcriptional regulator